MSTKLLDLVNITKSYDGVTILDDLNLYIRENEFLTLLGPSGCGKTTTLRILGGFETPDAGKVLFNGQDITQLPPNKRQLNTVFQKYALFTHMTIAENIAFGLKIKRKSKAYIDDKIKYALKPSTSRDTRTAPRRFSPAASSSESLLRAQLSTSRRFCFLMSRSVRST